MVALSEHVLIGGVETPVEVTDRAHDALVGLGYREEDLVRRHAAGDWGNASENDWQLNQLALKNGDILVSSYRLSGNCVIWVVTPADRSKTIVLTPSESTRYLSLI